MRLSREEVRTVTCPKCEAPPNARCSGERASSATNDHERVNEAKRLIVERHAAVIAVVKAWDDEDVNGLATAIVRLRPYA